MSNAFTVFARCKWPLNLIRQGTLSLAPRDSILTRDNLGAVYAYNMDLKCRIFANILSEFRRYDSADCHNGCRLVTAMFHQVPHTSWTR